MSVWKEIKAAINSTLGTNNFKPLNELMTDLVFNERRFIPSDRMYNDFKTGEIVGRPNLEEKIVPLFTTQIDGNFTLKFTTGYYSIITVYVNGESVFYESNYGNSTVINSSPTIVVKKGDTVSIGVMGSGTGRTGSVSNVRMFAEVVDNANMIVLYGQE